MEEYAEVLNRLAQDLYTQGKISSLYANLPFEERLIAIYQESGKVHSQYFNTSLPPDGFTEDTPYWAGQNLFQTLRHPRLLDAIESIIGSEICATPILHVRIKPPENLTPRDDRGHIQLDKTPIHQDNAGILPEADATDMLTVWFPMNYTDMKNGCLCVWPGSHHLGLLPHCIDRGRPRIPTEFLKEIGKAVPVPVKQGGVLLMNKCTVHASYANRSEKIRWSFDLRYTPTHQPKVRDFFPDFIARSRLHPETELKDPIQWDLQWQETRQKLAKTGTPQFHRW
ncbi:MAG: phytanoyl-CoA dioxygenase family protein [Hormoscilla sp. GM7CHS1pb]|nr:phytanoyl-CoA dioxygenase family protein [Hormoscilla sp. GM7CHS1pb]UDF05926.1 ORF6 [Hormoscilla sp. GUM007]